MKMRTKRLRIWLAVATLIATTLLNVGNCSAQHTLTMLGGTGVSFGRFYPAEETKMLNGAECYGISWRYYSPKPRFVGAVGLDLEYLERGFNLGWVYTSEFVGEGADRKEKRTYYYYTRRVNSLMLPLVWQPHFDLAKNHLRIYLEAAVVLSYNISSSYQYSDTSVLPESHQRPTEEIPYEWKVPRDNRFGYGLAGGIGFSVLLGRVEFGVRGRYYFGYSDLMKNRNKYYSNTTDGIENPFYYSPLRSPIDNINVTITLGWRFNKRGFDEWFVVRPKKENKLKSFNFSQQTGKSQGGNKSQGGRSSGAPGGRPTGAPSGRPGAPGGAPGGVPSRAGVTR